MKKTLLVLSIPFVISACGGPAGPLPDELKEMKPACAAGDFAVCAEIGHAVRDSRLEPTVYKISEPIVD